MQHLETDAGRAVNGPATMLLLLYLPEEKWTAPCGAFGVRPLGHLALFADYLSRLISK